MEKEIVWVEEKIFYTWTWTISDTRKFVIEKYGGSYRLLRYGFGSDGLLGVPHYTLDKAKDEAVWHYLRAYPDMTMSEDGARLVPRVKDEQSIRPKKIQTESRNPQQENPVGPKQIIQYVDRSKTQPVASAGLPHNVPANLRNHRQMTESASPSTSLHEGNTSFIPNSDSGLDSGKTTAIGKPMITHETPIAEVLHILGAHGCENITDQLDTSSFSKYPISSGGYGDIYRGALRNGTAIAVKCLRLHPDLNETTNKQLKRAARELYVWSKCGHPNVLGLIGVAQYREQIAMVSPWMERGSLRLLLFRQEEFDRYAMCVQITDGVAYMHRENMVHGDLKCDNVLISSDFIPKITDFGNASLKEYTLQFTNTTSSAGISLNWVAPEMLTGQSQATMGSDVYSLGMTLLEAITGEVPYNGMSHHMIMFAKVMTRALPVRPEAHIPSHIQHANLLWSLFESCWAFNPEDRPSAHKVKEMMEQVMMTRGSGNPSE